MKTKMMRVGDVQKYLNDFSPDAEVLVIVDSSPWQYELLYGTSEGCTKETAEHVCFYVTSGEEISGEKPE